jgi:hypothetical protein
LWKKMNNISYVVRVLLLIFLIFVFGCEVFLLKSIFTHPAGAAVEDGVLVKYSVVAMMPFLGMYVCMFNKRFGFYDLRYLIGFCVVGLMFFEMALRQYGHATPGLLFLGYVGQWIFLLIYFAKRRRPRSSI